MASITAAIDQNNRAIALLEKGDSVQALIEIKKAAQLMYSTTQEIKARHQAARNDATIPKKPYRPREGSIMERSICTSNSFIRSTPFIMAHSSSPEEPISSCTIESAIVLVNMALCYHLDSLQPNAVVDAIHNAITLYDMAYSLSLQARDDSQSHAIILMALNNIGQLYHEAGNFEKSRLYFGDVSSYVVMVEELGEGHTVSNRHDFVLNAMVMRNPRKCAGAA